MTGPGGNLALNPATGEMEVEDVILILGYEWEELLAEGVRRVSRRALGIRGLCTLGR